MWQKTTFNVTSHSIFMLLAVLISLTSFGESQDTRKRPDSRSAPELTAADVATFFDGLMLPQFRRYDIPGAVVAIVKDGQVVFTKGYGYADVAAKRPVSADATLFWIASISKLFTWTAVMQCVEQGKLELDRDVNEYLDFRIPATYPQPITLRHLMTHTAGFQEALFDSAVPPSQLPSLKEWPSRREAVIIRTVFRTQRSRLHRRLEC